MWSRGRRRSRVILLGPASPILYHIFTSSFPLRRAKIKEMMGHTVFEGQAILIWELPTSLRNSEVELRAFFARHFEGTPAATIKAVVFDGDADGLDSCDENKKILVEFEGKEAVEVVLSRIIQHELRERDEEQQVELRRGYVHIGHVRLLVEGVMSTHNIVTSPPRDDTETESSTSLVDIGRGSGTNRLHVPSSSSSTSSVGQYVVVSDASSPTDSPRARAAAKKDRRCPTGNGSAQAHVISVDVDERTDNSVGCSDHAAPQSHEGSANVTLASERGEVEDKGSVVLCLIFELLMDGVKRSGASTGAANAGEFGLSPHSVFKLIQSTCLARQIVMLPSNPSRGPGGRANERNHVFRALVEVGSLSDALAVRDDFHNAVVDLANNQNSGEGEVEFRFRLRVVLNNKPDARRQLRVPLNTQTELSLTPKNLAKMGGRFDCVRFEGEKQAENPKSGSLEPKRTESSERKIQTLTGGRTDSASPVGGGTTHKLPRKRSRERQEVNGNCCGSRDSQRSSRSRAHQHRQDYKVPSRQVERSSSSPSATSGAQNGSVSLEHYVHYHNYHRNHSFNADPRFAQQYPVPAHNLTQIGHSTHDSHANNLVNGGMAGKNYNNDYLVLLQQQLQQNQQQQLFSQYGSMYPQLPFGWRPVYSEQYKKTYYVYRNPETGVETTSWDLPTAG